MTDNSNDAVIRRLGEERKAIGAAPHWYFDNADKTKLRLHVPLSIDLVIEEGLYLDCHCRSDDPEVDVTLNLSYNPVSGLSGALSRFDWKPVHTHGNGGLGRQEWRFKEFSTTHSHPFDENFLLGAERMFRGNLPIAYPIFTPLISFREMLECAGEALRIDDIQRLPEPPWTRRLF